ncbi:MAG: hypothetical protein LBJ70_04480 [Holosporales bacterium]|nr:hypothetical protein [Holosporales bacterium]
MPLFAENFADSIEKTPQEEKIYKSFSLKPEEKLRSEVIRYLGYKREADVTPEIAVLLQKGMAEVCAVAEPRAIYRVFSTRESPHPENACHAPLSQQEGLVLMAVTLGVSVDRALDRAQIQDMTYALVLDSCATAAIESICDAVQGKVTEAYAHRKKHLTNRYSPGYGSLPLSTQPKLLSLLDAERKIGLSTTPSFLLTPSKSVTAMMWVSSLPQKDAHTSCEACNMHQVCHFRRQEGPIVHDA